MVGDGGRWWEIGYLRHPHPLHVEAAPEAHHVAEDMLTERHEGTTGRLGKQCRRLDLGEVANAVEGEGEGEKEGKGASTGERGAGISTSSAVCAAADEASREAEERAVAGCPPPKTSTSVRASRPRPDGRCIRKGFWRKVRQGARGGSLRRGAADEGAIGWEAPASRRRIANLG